MIANTQITSAEQEWLRVYTGGRAARGVDAEEQAARNSFDRFIATVRANGLVLGAPPKTLLPHATSRGPHNLEVMDHCLGQAEDKAGQAALFDFLPSSLQESSAMFAVGFGVAANFLHGIRPDEENHRLAVKRNHAYRRIKEIGMRYVLSCRHHAPIGEYLRFFATLDAVPPGNKAGTLNELDKVVLAKTALLASTTPQHRGSLTALVEWAERTKKQVGATTYQAILKTYQPEHETLDALLRLMQIAVSLPAGIDLAAQLKAIASGTEHRTDALIEQLQVQVHAWFANLGAKRSIEDLRAVFAGTEPYALSEAVLNAIEADYKVMDAHQPQVQAMSGAEFKAAIEQLKQDVNSAGEIARAQSCLLAALLRDGVRRAHGITPYDTQMFVLFGLLTYPEARGRIAQMKTGEGKSTVVAMLAGYMAVAGKCVDIISSSPSLARRDAKKARAYFEVLGITSGDVCMSQQTVSDFAPQVLFGANHSFEWAILYDMFGKKTRGDRPCEVAIVDEVDNMLLDEAWASSVIGMSVRDKTSWTVPHIAQFRSDLIEVGARLDFSEAETGRLRTHLEVAANSAEAVASLRGISDKALMDWLRSCEEAEAKREDIDYVLHVPTEWNGYGKKGIKQIVSLDMNTGHRHDGCRWGKRLHQFLELKHGLEVLDDLVSGAQMAHPVFFGGYCALYGLTGTAGTAEERKELEDVFGVTTFDVPPHRPSQRDDNGVSFFEDEAALFEQAHAKAVDMIKAGRPLLVVMKTVKESKALTKYLGGKGLDCQLYNGVQTEDEEYVVARAGREGMVTVATNVAGRGTDIVLTQHCRDAGGLHVILAFWPNSERVEAQGLGRAGRQGQKGSTDIYVQEAEIPADTPRIVWEEALYEERTQKAEQDAKRRSVHSVAAKVHNGWMRRFFEALSGWKDAIDRDFLISLDAMLRQRAHGTRTAHDYAGLFQAADKHLVDLMVSARAPSCRDQHFMAWLASRKNDIADDMIQKWADFSDAAMEQSEAERTHATASQVGKAQATEQDFTTFLEALDAPLRSPQALFMADLNALLDVITSAG